MIVKVQPALWPNPGTIAVDSHPSGTQEHPKSSTISFCATY